MDVFFGNGVEWHKRARHVVYQAGLEWKIEGEAVEGLRRAGQEKYGGAVVERVMPLHEEISER